MPLREAPGGAARRPGRRSPTYAVRAPLVCWLGREAGAARTRWPQGYRMVDVGSGAKPYQPLFAAGASEYLGVDSSSPRADVRAEVDRLPFPDASFDLVLCTQVLEHAPHPDAVVRELRRVVARGGRVLASTHGVQVYHPNPLDLHRWTHSGLERLFGDNGDWSALTVSPGSGTAACVGMLTSIYVDLLARRLRAGAVGGAVVAAINGTAELVDRRAAVLRTPAPGTIFANYHVTALP
jgi:SAM-dependent methyltransferase